MKCFWTKQRRNDRQVHRGRRSERSERPSFRLECLEERQLLAGDCQVIYDSGDKALGAIGTDFADVATVKPVGNKIAIELDCGNGQSASKSVKAKKVNIVIFDARAGNDKFQNDTDKMSIAWGKEGNDTLYGGPGVDVLFGHEGDDFIFGNGGNDTLHGDYGDDTLIGGLGDDKIKGDGDDDTLFGDNFCLFNQLPCQTGGNDSLYGGWGADLLQGGLGDDLLDGGDDNQFENDTLYGHAGKDTFVMYGKWHGSVYTILPDLIKDFQSEDKLLVLWDPPTW